MDPTNAYFTPALRWLFNPIKKIYRKLQGDALPIDQLPVEVTTHILSYIHFSDYPNAALACKSLYVAAKPILDERKNHLKTALIVCCHLKQFFIPNCRSYPPVLSRDQCQSVTEVISQSPRIVVNKQEDLCSRRSVILRRKSYWMDTNCLAISECKIDVICISTHALHALHIAANHFSEMFERKPEYDRVYNLIGEGVLRSSLDKKTENSAKIKIET